MGEGVRGAWSWDVCGCSWDMFMVEFMGYARASCLDMLEASQDVCVCSWTCLDVFMGCVCECVL